MRRLKFSVMLVFAALLTGCVYQSAMEGEKALFTGNYNVAIDEFKTSLAREGDTGKESCTYSFMLGKAYFDNKQYSEAITYLKRAIDMAPKINCNTWGLFPAWHFWLGKAYYVNRQYKEAVVYFNKAANIAPDKIPDKIPYDRFPQWKSRTLLPLKSDCYLWLGDSYDQLGQFEQALTAHKKLIEILPNDSGSFVNLSTLYFKNKQYDGAITAAKRAIELKSDNAVAYTILGAAYGMKKQYDEAIKALQKAIEINPKISQAYGWMGRFLMDKGAFNEAVGVYKKSIEAAPFIPTSHESLAVTYYRMGRYDDAIATVNKAIELLTLPSGVGIRFYIKTGYPVVNVVMNTGPAKKADIQAGDKIIEIDGKSTEGWNIEKVVQSIRGTVGTQVILTIERKGDKIKKAVARENIVTEEAAKSIGIRSLIYRHKGDLNKAFSDAEMSSTLNPSDDYVRLSLGVAYLDRGQYDESIKLLSQIKDSPPARILEATAYAKLGKMKEAVNVYFSIPEEKMSPKNIPLMNNRMVLLQTFKPFVKEHRDKARSFESKGQYKEALSELSEALKTADDTETQDIQETIFSMIRRNPLLSEMPEDARKYVLRGEMLTKEGNFEQAATEFKKAIQIAPYAARLYYNSALINAELKKYPEAIRHMKIYLQAAPDAPDARDAKDEIIKWEFMMEKGK